MQSESHVISVTHVGATTMFQGISLRSFFDSDIKADETRNSGFFASPFGKPSTPFTPTLLTVSDVLDSAD